MHRQGQERFSAPMLETRTCHDAHFCCRANQSRCRAHIALRCQFCRGRSPRRGKPWSSSRGPARPGSDWRRGKRLRPADLRSNCWTMSSSAIASQWWSSSCSRPGARVRAPGRVRSPCLEADWTYSENCRSWLSCLMDLGRYRTQAPSFWRGHCRGY